MDSAAIWVEIGEGILELVQGDITDQDCEALVNAANSGLRGGGGVDGAIHRRGGPSIMEECRKLGGCPTGEARITGGGKLKARYVIHAVGPVWQGGSRGEEALLRSAYNSSLNLAREKGIESLAFPSISTGAYGYPLDKAAAVALSASLGFLKSPGPPPKLLRFVLFSASDFEIYTKTLEGLNGRI